VDRKRERWELIDFFENSKVTMDGVLTAHTEATIERMKEHRVVLVPQDTTTLHYRTHPMTEGLGPINNTEDQAIGWLLHDTLGLYRGGHAPGHLGCSGLGAGPAEEGEKDIGAKNCPLSRRKAGKWLRSFQKAAQVQKLCPETMLVVIGGPRVGYLRAVSGGRPRARRPQTLGAGGETRNRKVDQEFLWDFMAKQDVAGLLNIHVPRSRFAPGSGYLGGYPLFAEVALQAPKRLGAAAPAVTVWAVYVLEQTCGTVGSPIEWMLRTTVEVKGFAPGPKGG